MFIPTRKHGIGQYRQVHELRLNDTSVGNSFSVILRKFRRQRSHSCLLSWYRLTKNMTCASTSSEPSGIASI